MKKKSWPRQLLKKEELAKYSKGLTNIFIDRIFEEYQTFEGEMDYKTFLDKEELEDISVDKMTLADREAWTDENLDMLFDYVTELDSKLHKVYYWYLNAPQEHFCPHLLNSMYIDERHDR